MIQDFIHISHFIQSNPTSSALDLGLILEPDPAPFTFETIGWQTLFFLLFAGILFMVFKIYHKYQQNKYRRDAILSVRELEKDFSTNTIESILKTLFLLKQTALQTFDRKDVAALYGINWLQFLDQKAKHTNFQQYQEIIEDSVYKEELQPENNFNATVFINMSIKWIKEHA